MKSLTDELGKKKKIMIDTNVVIYFLEGSEEWGDFSKEVFSIIEKGVVEGFISVITVAEVLVKPMKQHNNMLINKITRFLETFPNLHVVDLEKSIAMEAAKIRGRTGLKMPDALIVSSAKVLGCVVVGTDNQWDNKDLGVEFYNINRKL
ncbi:MAG: PIN domain-containing protein [Clostridia bacterium]|nr:PIN domain-containing protein [Clostridia bacterium]MDD4048195.1 PIN domain-containing protein [Clostridia bacterium]